MDDQLIDLTVIQVTDPHNFLAKEVANVSKRNMTAEYCSFLQLAEQMKRHFEGEQESMLQTSPTIGSMYAAKRQADQCWYRVTVVNIYTTTRGQQAQCKFVDYGNVEMVSTNLIRTLPKYFQDLPFQVQTYSLSGIQPLTLDFDENLIAVKKPCKRWDNAAIEFFRNLIKESENIQAKMIYRDPKGMNLVKLYVKMEGEHICVNEELCKLEYAKYKDTNESPTTDSQAAKQKDRLPLGRNRQTILHYSQQQKRKLNVQQSGSNSQPDISDHRLIQTTSHPSCVLGLGRAGKNPTDFTTDSDSASHIRAVPAGIAHNSQLRKSKRRPNGYQDVQSVASAVDRTVDSSWDCTTDLSAIPFPKSVSTSKCVTGVSIGRGSLSLGEASDSGSESRQSALFYSRLCRPRQCASVSASASGSDVSDTEQGGRSPRKIGRGQMLAAARGDGPGGYDLTEDLVHKMDDLFRHGRQEMPKPDFGPVVDDKPKYGEKFTVSPPSSRHSLEGGSAKDPHVSCVSASLPRKLGRGDLLATAVGYASDTGLEAVSAPTVPSLARGQLLGEAVQSMDHRGFGKGRGCLSDSGDELRSLPKKFGRGQIQSMFSKSDCSSEVCSTPKPTSPARLDSPPSALSRTAGKSLGRGQFLLNLVTNKPAAVGARERPEMNSGRYEDAEEKIVNSSNVERDKSKNYKEESVTSKYQRDVDVTNHSVTSDPLRDVGSQSVVSDSLRGVGSHSVTSDSLRDAGSQSVTSDSLRGVGSQSVTSDSLRGVGSHSVTSDSLRDAGSHSVTSDSLLGVGSQCVASECERHAGVGSESVRNSSSSSNMDSAPGWSLPFVKARRPKCAHDQMLQNQTGLPKEKTSYKQTVPLKEMPYSQTLLLKEMAHSQTVLPKEMAHNQAVSPKEMAHNQTVSPKEMAHNQTVSPKMISPNQTVSPKEMPYSQTLLLKEMAHSQTVSPKMISPNQTVSPKEMPYSQTLLLKEMSLNQMVSPNEMPPKMISHNQNVSPKATTSHKQIVSPREMTSCNQTVSLKEISHNQTVSPKEMTSHNQVVSAKEMTSHNQTMFPQTELARSRSCFTVKETRENTTTHVRFAKDRGSDNEMSTHIPESFLQLKRELEGQKLLDMIRPNNMTTRSTILPQISRSDRPTPDPFLGVIVNGISQPPPLLDYTNLPFSENIQKAFEEDADIFAIQAYTWTPILRGRCVVGVAPPQSGKTVAYLPAILSQIYSPGSYLDVARGNGPLALILVPSWKKVQDVFDFCSEVFVQGRKNTRVIPLYAGGCKDGYEVRLINGCEVLIATPPCFLRMVEKQCTNLNRLCHLVLDDAEILTEEFTAEMQKVMRVFAEARKGQKARSLTTQLLLFGSQWTAGIESFTKTFLSEPLIVLTSLCESAVYGRVKQIVHLCSSSQRLAQVCGLIEEVAIPGQKVVICTSDKSEVSSIQQLLSTRSVLSLAVHTGSEEHIKNQCVHQWTTMDNTESAVVLVTNDECLIDLAIVDATAVIHFGIPGSKTKFGARLACMKNYFYDVTNIDENPKPPSSHIIVAKELDADKIQSLMKLLKRSNCNIPSQLNDMIAGIQAWQNEDGQRELCRNLKALGFCVAENQCKSRHHVIAGIDDVTELGYSTLPSCGKVKVRLNHIVDANHFYMRVLEHEMPDGTVTDFSGAYLELLMAMAHYFNVRKHHRSLSEVKIGMLCAVEQQNIYHRVKIVDWKDSTTKEVAKAQVWFVDDGRMEDMMLQDLFVLPKELAAYPYQAVEVFLACVKPMDKDTEWTPMVNSFIVNQLHKSHGDDQEDDEWRLDGQVLLSLGNTLWLDPLVKRSHLRSINVVTNKFNIRKQLIKNGLAEENPEHMTNLYKLCENVIDLPASLTKKVTEDEKEEEFIEGEVLPRDSQYHDVIVTAVESPHLFYVQNCKTSVQLNDMLDEINQKIADSALKIPHNATLRCGSLCLAQFSQDERWYRGKVTGVEDGGFRVYFFDYGDKEVVNRSDVKPLPEEYAKLPGQAVPCRLDGIKPIGDSWDVEAGNALWDMAHFLTNEKCYLVAKVVGEEHCAESGSQTYVVSLYNTNCQDDRSLAQELVWRQYAHCDPAGSLKDLFRRPALTEANIYPSALHKIEDLCSLLYWSQAGNAELAVSKSAQVHHLITESLLSPRFEEDLLESGSVSDLCCLIGYLTNIQCHEYILHTIVKIALHSESLCQACLAEGICISLLRCIEQGLIPEIQQQACHALSEMITSERFRSALAESSPVSTLSDYSETTDDEQLQCGIYKLLANLLQGSESIISEVKSVGVCQKSASLLSTADTHELTEALLTFFAAVAAWERSHCEITREAVLESVISSMSDSDCSKCIYQCALFCRFLSQASRKNKTLLLEHKVVVVLNRLLNEKLDTRTRGLCQALESSLAVRLPEQPVIMNWPCQSGGQARSAPTVTWAQNIFKVVLTVKVDGAKKEDFTVTENSIIFRSSHGTEEQFRYDLFGKIYPDKLKLSVSSSEVLLSLRKVDKGKWSRLTKDKQKLSNLTVDFDKMATSSDSEQTDVEDPFTLVKGKSRLPRPSEPVSKAHLEYPVYSDESDSLLSLSDDDVTADGNIFD